MSLDREHFSAAVRDVTVGTGSRMSHRVDTPPRRRARSSRGTQHSEERARALLYETALRLKVAGPDVNESPYAIVGA